MLGEQLEGPSAIRNASAGFASIPKALRRASRWGGGSSSARRARVGQLVEACEGEPSLGLRARGRQNAEALARRIPTRLGEERRLADAGLSAKHERASVLGDAVHELVDRP